MSGHDPYDSHSGAQPPGGGPYPASGPAYPGPGVPYPAPGVSHGAPGHPHPSHHPVHGSTPSTAWSTPPMRAAHKPGAVPLRPLRLGDIFDAAIRIIRFNPGATVGAALLFSAVPLLVPIVATGALLPSLDLTQDLGTQDVGLIVSLGAAWGLALLAQWLGVTLVTGMTAQVAYAATLGQTMSLGQAWAATRGARWRLVGLAFLLLFLMTAAAAVYVLVTVGAVMTGNVMGIVAWFLFSLPSGVALSIWFWVKFYLLAVPVLMIERTGVVGALSRGSKLVSGHFWRVLGISVLVVMLTQIASGIISVPLLILGEVPGLMGAGQATVVVAMVASQSLSQIVATALVTPFLSAVTALLYIDARIRKEAFDVELLTRSNVGATPS